MRFGGAFAMALGLLVAGCADTYQQQRAALEPQHAHATCARLSGETRLSCKPPHAVASSPSVPNWPVNTPASRFAAQPTISVSDSVPVINVEQVCHGIADQSASPSENHEKATKHCLDTEEEVRNSLMKVWARFDTADRNHCVNEARMGGESSYTELLTCLEMAADVRKIHEQTDTIRHAQSVGQR